eukprot:TRINITY_DN2743_c3_g3_i1.p1 TRINITY_DN2743_c3_g3~~TRINITY_DN2743_c3_g3_i1.p1  ORF type:complete len:251 (+),score=7.16 TRINITY_DN2743_c3_g3_i1:108-755(+)
MTEAGNSARTFAVMSAVHSGVTSALKQIRKKDDVINHAVAGCATGIALGWGGTPVTMLQNCAGFAVFAFIFEGMNPPAQPAIAAEMRTLGLLPPSTTTTTTSSCYGDNTWRGDATEALCCPSAPLLCGNAVARSATVQSLAARSVAAAAVLTLSAGLRGSAAAASAHRSQPLVGGAEVMSAVSLPPLSLALPVGAASGVWGHSNEQCGKMMAWAC